MKRLLIIAACAALSACQGMSVEAGGPATVASKTALDEQLAIGAENAYQAAALAMIAADQAGLLKSADRAKLRQLDSEVYARLQLVRRAYDAGNAASYREAIDAAWPLIRQLFTLVPIVRSGA